MSLDPATLVVVACIMSLVVGGLLFFSWLQDRRTDALAWWSATCVIAAAASLLFLVGGTEMRSTGRELGNACFAFAYAVSYGAARRFNDRSISVVVVVAAPIVWLVAVWGIDIAFVGRVVLMSVLATAYGLATAYELWNGPDRLVSQRAAAVVTAAHALYFASRVFMGPALVPSMSWTQSFGGGFDQAWVSMVGLVILLYVMIFGFLIMSMAKEKTDLEHRRAALIDPLTGVANRRAFMLTAEAMLDVTRAAEQPAAVIMFDLDHFKSVNDTHGHSVGDDVLVEFARGAVSRLPRRAMFCRMGGEEFAAILPGSEQVEAIEVAERIRLDLMAETRCIPTTVSAGVAISAASHEGLAELLASADGALYRAKAAGRNRVIAVGGSAGRAAASAGVSPALGAVA